MEFNFCLSDEKTVEKEEKRKFYFWVFCVSLFYILIFPLVADVRLSNKNCFPYYYNAKSEKNKNKNKNKKNVWITVASFLISVR